MTHSYLSQRMSRGTQSLSRRAQFLTTIAALLAFAALAMVAVPHATAAISDEEELTKVGSTGSGAGQLKLPAGIASEATTGHFYVVEEDNERMSEFTPWGNFVKAFGWDVAPGAVNEQQEVRVRAAEGQFKLSFGASPTADLAFNAPGSESEGPGSVEAALNALPSISDAGGEVSVEAIPGTPDGKTPYIYVVAFKGTLAGTNVGQLTVTNGTTPLSGGVPSSTLEARTRADGTAAGTGLESCTAESGCKAGINGGGAGQFSLAKGIAMDAAGNLYVREAVAGIGSSNRRVQKFDSAGRFISMFGGEVNKTKVEAAAPEAEQNICPVDPGDVCQAGTAGTGNGQFESGFSSGIALCTGSLFVADKDRIQRFSLAGAFEASLPVPGEKVLGLACDPISGDLYTTFEGGSSGVHKLDSITGEVIGAPLEGGGGAIATDSAGNLFAAFQGRKVLEYDSSGKPLSPSSCCELPFASNIRFDALGTNAAGDLTVAYRSAVSENFVRIYGPPPVMFEAPPQIPPTISGQFATSVGRDDATVAVEINPHFWTDTSYYVEYGTGKCSEGGCEEVKPLPPGAILTSKVTDETLRSAGIFLEGLQPGTTYHYRFVAQSTGGGPVRGVGGEVGIDGKESAFTTYPVPAPLKTDCSNQAFRTGFSSPLPDCRAFEMVSPIDKNNGDIVSLLDFPSFTTALSQSALNGSRFTYSSYRSFGDPKGAPYTNQYLASRSPATGWSSEALDQAMVVRGLGQQSFENKYKAFSADLCSSWLMLTATPVLAPGAPPGFEELYRRDACAPASYEALIQVEPSPEEVPGFVFYPVLLGASADNRKAIFGAKDNLTPEAPEGLWQTYYASEGQLHLVCVAPNGLPSGGSCWAGTGPLVGDAALLVSRERYSSITHAISADGDRVYWTDSGSQESGPGKVYLRLNPDQEQSEVSGGECTEAEKACTLKVSETVTSQASRFLGASADGSKALFDITKGAQEGNLYLFDLEEPASPTLIAGEALGVAGTSEDLSHMYFVFEKALPETSGATEGKPNLYLDQEGTKTFIATISKDDAVARKPSNAAFEPVYHAARVTADGSSLAFISTESLTGYDNTDLVTGEADSEVFIYEAGSPGPLCVSCNPSGARPVGRHMLGAGNSPEVLSAAGWLTMPENQLYFPRVLSADGGRLFFNSFDALLLRDTNGKGDVYEWQAASSAKECKEQGAELYVASSGGCISLISSGQSPSHSEFLDASKNGSDAFFTTASTLLPQDPGLVDVYDAREGGGLPAPPEPPGPCQGEACQFAPPPPNDPTPASASFKGAGNLKPRSRCAKNKVARKGRCVAKKRKQAKRKNHARNANNNRRTSR